MEELLKERQREVLKMIVSTYVRTINPVGSRTIAKFYQDELSPATIRNEMHGLEERDYIQQPHTSAGRVPTDKGYRYYVDHLMPEPRVLPYVVALVAREYREHMDNVETLIERTSKILSTLSEQAGFVVFPAFENLVLKRVEITSLGRHHLLIVWVSDNGFVQNQVIDMKEDIPSEELLRINRFLNQELQGMLLGQVKLHLAQKFDQVQDSLKTVYRTARGIVNQSFPKEGQRRLAFEGSHYILEQPEFQDWEKSRKLFKTLEARDSFMDLLQVRQKDGKIQVKIGFEHHCPDIWDCSLITTEYRVGPRAIGTLGVLGPRRMSYERVIGLVDFISRRFGEALEQWI
ncbi:MAG: heat-inducible transcription repressor HrcA [Candidatus Omnitrophica bacterium]|nr:heat-inducible transcription repressor HrcA [Candidatus Omnitrophota bacterium]